MNARKTDMYPKSQPLDLGALKGIAAGLGAGLLLIVVGWLLAVPAAPPRPAFRAAPTAAPAPTRANPPTAAPTAAPTLFPPEPGIVPLGAPLREVELVPPEVVQEAAAPTAWHPPFIRPECADWHPPMVPREGC